MKILYITNGIAGAGGLERVLSVKASLLADQFRYDVHLLSLNEEGLKTFFDFSDKIIRHSIEVAGNPLLYISAYKRGIQQKINEIQPDIISVCDDGLKGFFLPYILKTNAKIIYERHVSQLIELGSAAGMLSKLVTTFKFRLMNLLAHKFAHFVVLTDGNKKEWKLPNLIVIPNPLPFYPATAAVLNSKKVIAVGKQGYQKAYHLLLAAWAQLPTEKSGWELHVYGKIEPDLKLNDLAKHLEVSDSVFFHPPDINIEARFLESSIFVLSSRFEGFGMVIIEAMACGLPVVSFDCPYGPSDIISHGIDGFLINNGNVVDLAENIHSLMIDDSLRKQLGSKGRETAKQYLPEVVVMQWHNLFQRLFNQSSIKKSL